MLADDPPPIVPSMKTTDSAADQPSPARPRARGETASVPVERPFGAPLAPDPR